jgi:hypothetical protein
MGLCNSSDIFQEKISSLFKDQNFVTTYINDPLKISKGKWSEHLQHVDVVLQQLQDAELKVSANRSFFGTDELE